jgi:cardiolipin-specific phospholipase
VYALDWLGMGRSARVPFAIKAKRSDIPARVHEAESFFVDSLEEWRARMGLESMTLVAHSLGAYLGAAYALRHPARVSKLVLLSPAGVPRDPTLPPAPPSPRNSTLSSSASSSSAEWADAPQPGDAAAESGTKKGSRRYYMRQSRGARLLTYLWEEGWSPFQIVRLSLFWAPMLVGKYSARRFVGLSEEDTRNLHDYIVHITLAKGSGEYCITHLLAPGIHARIPLVDRIDKLKMPVTFVCAFLPEAISTVLMTEAHCSFYLFI